MELGLIFFLLLCSNFRLTKDSHWEMTAVFVVLLYNYLVQIYGDMDSK